MGRPITEYPESPSPVAVDLFRSETDLLRVALELFEDEMTDDTRARFEQALSERDAAIDRVEANVPDDWFDAAIWSLYELALARDELTADPLWVLLERKGKAPPHDPRAMGAVMRFGKSSGWIETTDRTVQSTRPENHARPIRVWKSRIKGKEVLA